MIESVLDDSYDLSPLEKSSRTPFSQLKLVSQKRHKLNIFKKGKFKKVFGFDTETNEGFARVITSSFSKKEYKRISDIDEGLEFLTRKKYRYSFNMFWNIQFDFDAIMKFLPIENFIELYSMGKTTYKDFKIEYIPRKFFTIATIKRKAKYTFYDASQYYDRKSLETASSEFLGEHKTGEDLDKNKMNTDLDYFNENLFKIILYCYQDSYLTQRLTDLFLENGKTDLQFYPKRPISGATIAREYFRDNCYIPPIDYFIGYVGEDRRKKEKIEPNPNYYARIKALEMFYTGYRAGRIEILQKGTFEKLYICDIKSAYAYGMTQLIDFTKGEWYKTNQYNEYATEGIYLCQVYSPENNFFSPFVRNNKAVSRNEYPNGVFYSILCKTEIDAYNRIFPNCDIKIIEGYEFIHNDEPSYYPFRETVKTLYKRKNECKSDEKIKKAFLKGLNNWYYGKTIQKVYPPEFKISNVWNPFYAYMITAYCRIALLTTAMQNPSSIVMFSTDSIHSTEKLNTPAYPELGDFEQKESGRCICVMAGIYEMDILKDGKIIKSTKHRGVPLKENDIPIILEERLRALSEGETSILYISKRPHHPKELIAQNKSKDLVNVWKTEEKEIACNTYEREFDREFKSGNDVLTSIVKSKPYNINDVALYQ